MLQILNEGLLSLIGGANPALAFVKVGSLPIRGMHVYMPSSSGKTGLLIKKVMMQKVHGNQKFKSETVLSYELGYRFWSSDRFYLDLAVFYNQYDDLIFAEFPDEPPGIGKIPLRIVNGEKADAWGVESTVDWRPYDWVRFQLSSSFLKTDFSQSQVSAIPSQFPTLPFQFPVDDKRDPQFQSSFRSSFDLSPPIEFDFWLRYVDTIPNL